MTKEYLLGYDIGSSSVKASLVEIESGKCAAKAFYPKEEAPIISKQIGWAEQDPLSWWNYLKEATAELLKTVPSPQVKAIGISYQMHGLVCVDKNYEPLRPSIIWCDSRAVPYGEAAFNKIGKEQCLEHMLNSPGNFTAAKLAWIKDKEAHIYERIHKIMLPGDYIAYKLTGQVLSTPSGLSEGTLWDFKANSPSRLVLDAFGFDEGILPQIVQSFSIQGQLSKEAAEEIGLKAGIPISYRAGDQPNNALSLNVLEPGQIAATAGTSGVVYGVSSSLQYDELSRVNSFAHVNHDAGKGENRIGILLCINGTGILNSWMRKNVAPSLSYAQMNQAASEVEIGSQGLCVLPFGNGAERILQNENRGCELYGLDFNTHTWKHMLRAAQEGIVFSFKMGIDIMQGMGLKISTIHAGKANMFLSPVFTQALASVSGACIELYDTDGSIGAARGAGIGAGIYANSTEAFRTLEKLEVIEPQHCEQYTECYLNWKDKLVK